MDERKTDLFVLEKGSLNEYEEFEWDGGVSVFLTREEAEGAQEKAQETFPNATYQVTCLPTQGKLHLLLGALLQ